MNRVLLSSQQLGALDKAAKAYSQAYAMYAAAVEQPRRKTGRSSGRTRGAR